MLPSVNQRIKFLIDNNCKGNVTEFSRLLGYNSPQKVNRLFKIDSRTNKYPTPSTDMIREISNTFDIPLEELIPSSPTTNNAHEKLRPSVSRTSPNLSLTKSNYMDKIKQLLNQDKDDPVNITSVYNVHLTTGKVSTLESGSKIPDLLLLNGAFKDCDLVIRHTDPAMHGFFETESFIGVKKITEESYRRRIIPGKVYVVVMEDYILERFLYPGTEKAFLLRAENPKQDHDFEIDYEEVVELYLIKGWVQAPRLKST